ncbi:hypothetical protein FJT64_014159 [Amphibalanus amphitrite]|uniref:ZP domain-containing protein n=1 Tax=Amphibalanus amphitrite TaxID=1232801 RepID=A0A6A4UUM4_AMPAM|nr:hypothetical protein FJT64_014159 [Amphibalanus amphitrite]
MLLRRLLFATLLIGVPAPEGFPDAEERSIERDSDIGHGGGHGGHGGGHGGHSAPSSGYGAPKPSGRCDKSLMRVNVQFDKPFNGIIFSKGHYSNYNCVHMQPNSGSANAQFDISINACGTTGNSDDGQYGGYGKDSGSGTYFENTIIMQYDPQVQEVWDQARKLRCTWHNQYEKAVTFRPFPVDMLDVVRADFAGDNCRLLDADPGRKGPAFKFPDSMEVHFQCTVQICRYQCPEQCVQGGGIAPGIEPRPANAYDAPPC